VTPFGQLLSTSSSSPHVLIVGYKLAIDCGT